MALHLLLLVAASPIQLQAQHGHERADSTKRMSAGAMLAAVYSRAAPGPHKTTISEAYLTQPMASGTLRTGGGRLRAFVTLNGEGLTLQRGEINPGVYGEGYVDRRHPHTWLHEAMLGVASRSTSLGWSLHAGKGFVPYGTDDPMVRPFVKYPVNHHHAQLLERVMVTASLGWRGATLEGATFNGDEPESTTDLPNDDRLFDSWAARVTLRPRRGLEGSASVARVSSPEFAAGGGLDQRKESASFRWSGTGRLSYALVEYARNREYSGATRAFTFDSWLAEGSMSLGAPGSVSVRVEETTRPEEERSVSSFRTVRPLHDFNIIGRTRWTNVSVSLAGRGRERGPLSGRPFVEVGYHRPRATFQPAALDPVEFFGARSIWMFSVGVRLHAGTMRPRFGRYADVP